MGLAIHEIPLVGTLDPRERRELARWLRTVVPRGERTTLSALAKALSSSAYAHRVTVEQLLSVQWLELDADGYNVDTYARRIAAGAVDGSVLVMY